MSFVSKLLCVCICYFVLNFPDCARYVVCLAVRIQFSAAFHLILNKTNFLETAEIISIVLFCVFCMRCFTVRELCLETHIAVKY